MWKQFIASLLASLIVVGGFSLGLAALLSPVLPFWITFASFTIIIWAGVTAVKSIIQQKKELAELEILKKIDFEDDRNTVLITCPCQQNTFAMQVYPTIENEYVCDVCKNKFTVGVTVEPVLQTNPINLDNAYKIFETLKQEEQKQP